MLVREEGGRVRFFSTCPSNTTSPGGPAPIGAARERSDTYMQHVVEAARWSEECGFEGMLIYVDNSLVDNWAVAQVVLEHTRRLIPLIAVQPIYMHPYWLAKQISTLAYLYGRPLALNLVAGAFRNDLLALGDETPHDERYARLTEYGRVVLGLLSGGDDPFTLEGRYYTVRNVKLSPPLPPELMPAVLLSGSSAAGMQAARDLGAVAVRYPQPVDHYESHPLEPGLEFGVRLGIIAREYEEDAWEVARKRFPPDRKGQLTHQLAKKTSDSVWHREISSLESNLPTREYPYWLEPFKNYKTFCPYLVGSYRQIAEIVARYMAVGFGTFITDIPPSKEELLHQKIVFELALKAPRDVPGGAAREVRAR